jgi:hypothetical protein
LLSPVFNFTQTIARLDQAFARDLNPFPENYDPLREVLSLERDAHLPWISREEIESRAAKMTSLAFFEKLSGNLGGLRERGQCSQDKVKYISEDPPRRLNFTALIEACAAEMGNEHAPNQLSLENLWTDSNRGGQITLLTTTDDPLNSRGEAERFKATFTGRARVLILPFGGHTGFVYSDWLKHFLRRAFKD